MRLSRDDYRKIKSLSKEEMERWLQAEHNITYERLRKEFNENYKDELDNSVQNFLIAIAFTLHFNEDVNLSNDELAGFMDDLFVSVDLFRKGEYKPEDYAEQLKEDGVVFSEYDYDKLYREKDAPYKEKYDNLVKYVTESKSRAKVIDEIKSILGI